MLTGGELEIECVYRCVHSVWLILPGDVNKQTRTVALPDSECFFENRVGGRIKGYRTLVGKGGTAESCKIILTI